MLRDKVAIVTGGAGGVGEGICRVLAKKGAAVAVSHLPFEQENAQKVAETIVQSGGKAIAVAGDICEEADVEQMVKQTVEAFGTVHILVNCAGITIDGKVARLRKEDFEKVLSVNLIGTFLMSREVLKVMIPQQYGRIVNISSVAGLLGLAGASPYSASKAGLIGFTKSLAKEVGNKGITVNAICPSYIDAGQTKHVNPVLVEKKLATLPVSRLGTPAEVGEAVAFLASDAAGFTTGESLRVDGGSGM